ncbi:hypothetical protein ERJ75_000539300 [Trypanosoma vivax]|nr:hypothetical protein ERJ75_000539300 [Trypanosoma vivax]
MAFHDIQVTVFRVQFIPVRWIAVHRGRARYTIKRATPERSTVTIRRCRKKALVPPVHAVQRRGLVTGLAPLRGFTSNSSVAQRIATEEAVQLLVVLCVRMKLIKDSLVRGIGLVSSQHGTGLAAQAVGAAVVHAVRNPDLKLSLGRER